MIPDWVLHEVGRLHLHSLALERELRQIEEERETAVTADQRGGGLVPDTTGYVPTGIALGAPCSQPLPTHPTAADDGEGQEGEEGPGVQVPGD